MLFSVDRATEPGLLTQQLHLSFFEKSVLIVFLLKMFIQICFKEFIIQLPSEYIFRGPRVNRYLDIGVLELSKLKGEKIVCNKKYFTPWDRRL
ncbi:hypothetical protein Y032_0042g675 [Ancylostoma ceylanicum]|uniref:Uncharacterized protein n=1 Tax=Ancylostoma ceylanicum TaxID=53326 RepID=A0A016UGX2_9BILA|nr:hypothetical protein Y032_0042g675 [Ancylostoma ceylanicum]